jgi:hypothetical protein
VPIEPEGQTTNTKKDDFYKTGFWAAVAFIVALMVGQYSPNRNIVTVDQLNNSTKSFDAQTKEMNLKLDKISNDVATMKGQLEEMHKIK